MSCGAPSQQGFPCAIAASVRCYPVAPSRIEQPRTMPTLYALTSKQKEEEEYRPDGWTYVHEAVRMEDIKELKACAIGYPEDIDCPGAAAARRRRRCLYHLALAPPNPTNPALPRRARQHADVVRCPQRVPAAAVRAVDEAQGQPRAPRR